MIEWENTGTGSTREKEFGVYLGEKQDAEASVLLPKNRCRKGQRPGHDPGIYL